MAKAILARYDSSASVTTLMEDGESFKPGDVAFYVEAPLRTLLSCERLILNSMQRMSGIATHTRRLVDSVAHTSCKLLDTRKTTPNFRLAEKWAVHIGGGVNHRFALYDMIMLKDNHIDFCGGIGPAVERTIAFLQEKNLDLKIEVEVRTLRDVDEALQYNGIARLLLDNMTPDLVLKCVQRIQNQVETEASGGINETNLVAYAETGVNYVSLGNLTYGARPLDLSLKAVAN
jgi:nicotinate-nucleotide pyrophosphorylase (carboxylating)